MSEIVGSLIKDLERRVIELEAELARAQSAVAAVDEITPIPLLNGSAERIIQQLHEDAFEVAQQDLSVGMRGDFEYAAVLSWLADYIAASQPQEGGNV